MKKTKALMLCALMSLGTAQADYFVHATNTLWSLAPYTNSISLPQYTGPSNYLMSVRVTLVGSIGGTNYVQNLSDQINLVTLTAQSSFNLQKLDTSSLLTLNTFTQRLVSLAAFGGSHDFQPPDGATFSDLTASMTNSVFFSTPSDLSYFIGSSNFTLNLISLDTSSSTDTKGNHDYQHDLFSDAVLTVEYTTIPEPGTLLLISLGAGAVWLRRRTNRGGKSS